jgi:hypothetical protein
MKRLDHRTMLNWGRRAGLNTRELYSAMTGGRFTTQDMGTGEADGNGFVTDVGYAGKRVYRPNSNGRNN